MFAHVHKITCCKNFPCRPPFKASNQPVQMPPPSPPMLDEILSQMSQRDLPSTQLFRSNSEYFDNVKNKSYSSTKTVDSPSFNIERVFPQGSYSSQLGSQNGHNKWLTGGSQTAHSTYSQPSVFIDDEYDYEDEMGIQDSPELFTQQTDLYLDHIENSQGRINISQPFKP